MATWECGIRLTPMTVEGDPPRRLLGVVWVNDGFAMDALAIHRLEPDSDRTARGRLVPAASALRT